MRSAESSDRLCPISDDGDNGDAALNAGLRFEFSARTFPGEANR
jgi:hypothetical protein